MERTIRAVGAVLLLLTLLVLVLASAGCGGEGAAGAAEDGYATTEVEPIDDTPTEYQYTEETPNRNYQVVNFSNDTDRTGMLTGYDIPTARAHVLTQSYEGLEEIGHELYLEGKREGYDIVVVSFAMDEGYGMESAETYVYFANPDLEEIYYDRMDPERETLKGN